MLAFMNRARLLGVVLAAAGCSHGEATSASEPRSAHPEHATTPPATTAQASAPDLRRHMLALYWIATKARDAVVAGDMPGAKQAAKVLADHDYAGTVPDDWRHWLTRMRQRADEISLAPNLEATARSVAALGEACGECHAQLQEGPHFRRREALAWRDPPDQLDERMYRHDVGADQLWVGLIRPSETAWQSGTMTLTRAPLSAPQHEGEEVHPLLAVRIEEIRGLAKQARAARSGVARAAVYGELLSRCASCHFQARAADPGE